MSMTPGFPVDCFRTRAHRSGTTLVDLRIATIGTGSRFGHMLPFVCMS
jgi:hypothetical protein